MLNGVSTPIEEPNLNELDQTRSELREGIENSREIVRQSRLLIALSESGGAPCGDGDDIPIAN
jgi:hypothetical protein